MSVQILPVRLHHRRSARTTLPLCEMREYHLSRVQEGASSLRGVAQARILTSSVLSQAPHNLITCEEVEFNEKNASSIHSIDGGSNQVVVAARR